MVVLKTITYTLSQIFSTYILQVLKYHRLSVSYQSYIGVLLHKHVNYNIIPKVSLFISSNFNSVVKKIVNRRTVLQEAHEEQ